MSSVKILSEMPPRPKKSVIIYSSSDEELKPDKPIITKQKPKSDYHQMIGEFMRKASLDKTLTKSEKMKKAHEMYKEWKLKN